MHTFQWSAIIVLLLLRWNPGQAPAREVVLVAHHDAAYDTLSNCASWPLPTRCTELTPTIPADSEPHRVLVLAAITRTQPIPGGLNAIDFGIGGYSPDSVSVEDWGPCPRILADYFEIQTPDWPDPDSGTAVVFLPCPSIPSATYSLWPIYWLELRAEHPCAVPLAPHPVQNGHYVLCGENEAISIDAYGTIGCGVSGSNPCP